MIQATINDSIIEAFLYEKFDGDKKKITDYINEFLHKYLAQSEDNKVFEEDKKRFHETYNEMKNGSMKLYTEEESRERTDKFIKNLCK